MLRKSGHIMLLCLLLLYVLPVRGVVLNGPDSWTWNGTSHYPGYLSYNNLMSMTPYYRINANTNAITDSVLNYPSVFTKSSYNQVISLEYTRQNKSDIAGNSWQLVLIVQVSSSGSSQLDTLTISDQNYRDVRLNTILSGTWSVTVISAQMLGTSNSAIQSDIRLVASSQLTYYRSMAGIAASLPGNPTLTGNELEVRWNGVANAEEYELQYVFIDSTDINAAAIIAHPAYAFDYPDPANPVYTPGFNYKEPVNIVETQTSYRLHTSYANGTLYCRVRPLGRMLDNTSVVSYGNWSGIGIYSFSSSFERHMIWQDVTSFAESGKHKEIISYYDGSMRKRQSITNFADGSNAQYEPYSVVAETKYDYEGRGVFTLLPTPVDTNIIAYHTFFNRNATGEYTKDNFDKINHAPADPLSFSYGAGFYYSTGVTSHFKSPQGLTSPMMSYVPVDSGYSFSQTAYMRDGTGRVAATGGVGPNHQIGSGHETRYLYGTATATELHRMFGSNVGNALHYKKNYTLDPNGQVSVAYLDQEGRTIATALAGASPSNVSSLAENVPQSITANLMQNNYVDTANRTSSLSYQIVNVVPGTTYSFTYNLTGVINSLGIACRSCVYQLNISITGPDGNPVSLTTGGSSVNTITDTIQNGSLSSCSTTSFTGSTVNFTATLPSIGAYTLTKTLLLTNGAIQAYLAWADSNGTWPNSATIAQNYLSQVDSSICDLSCTGAYKGTCTQQLAAQTPGWNSLSTAVQQQMIQNCITGKCNGMITQAMDSSVADQCASYLEQMKQSIIPGQQGSVNYNWWATAPPYTIQMPNPSGGVLIITADTLADSTYFQSWYADSLVKYHREYCHYTACVSREQAGVFQDQLGLINGLQAAQDSTFTPTGPTYYNIITGYNQAAVDSDPLFGPGGECSAYAVQMYDSLHYSVMQCGSLGIAAYYAYTTSYGPCNNGYTSSASNASIFYPGLSSPANDSVIQSRYWQLMKGCYINYRQKFIKLAEQGSCTFFTDTNAIVKDPTGNMPGDTASMNNAIAQQQQMATPYQQCQANVTGWKWTITDACGITDSAYNLNVAPRLYNYCIRHCNASNPLGVIYFSDTLSDADLNAVHTYLAGCDSNIETINPYAYTTQANYDAHDSSTGLPGNSFTAFSTPILTTTTVVAPCIQSILNYVNGEMVSKCSSGYWGQCGQVYSMDTNAIIAYPDAAICMDYTAGYASYQQFDVYMPAASDNGSYLTIAQNGKASGCAYVLSFFDTTNTLITNIRAVNNLVVQGSSPAGSTHTGATYAPDSLYYIYHSPPLQVTSLPACTLSYTGLKATIQRQGSPTSVTGWMYVTAYDISSATGTCHTSAGCVPAFTVTRTDTLAQGYHDSTTANEGYSSYPGYQDTCLAQLQAQATYYATQAYDSAYQAVSGNLLVALNKCFDSPFAEDFYVSYTQSEYHYTLYYYDQGGNLVQTVPPAGFDGTSVSFGTNGQWNGTSNPNHRLKSRYRHNSLQKVRWQLTPDADSSNYWYDDKAMLKISQNAKQRHQGLYSFTTYDGQARIVSVGEVKAASAVNITRSMLDQSSFLQSFQPSASLMSNINDYTYTIYDFALLSTVNTNVRNRVSWSARHTGSGNTGGVTSETYYGYDTHGNVSRLQQFIANLPPKLMTYDYDLISGKVNNVYYYNESSVLQFTHRYSYDADNRLNNVQTSKTGIIYDNDATYYYYPHGPLARLELGQDQVQGLDYYYTIHGWLKGINAVNDTLFSGRDPGRDGVPGLHPHFAQDDYSLILSYYKGDYQQAGGTTLSFTPTASWSNYSSNILGNGLYNGNITWQANSIATGITTGHPFTNGPLQAMAYEYDQLNRIKNSVAYNANHGTTQSGAAPYLEQYSYDQNGNILSLRRKNNSSATIDSLTYYYNKDANSNIISNRLYHYTDSSGDATSGTLLKQTTAFDNSSNVNNDNLFSYDSIGNVVYDSMSAISNIKWDVYGKITSITRKSGNGQSDLQFAYDHTGNRVLKIMIPKVSGSPAPQSQWVYTYYIRDASGNVMDAITSTGNVAPYANEFTVYGSSRLGTWTPATASVYKSGWLNSYGNDNRIMGNKVYELTNHLGNVMETVSDKKLGVMVGGVSNPATNYYLTQVMSANDYYAFGSLMPGRTFVGNAYRYGFNKGSEKDDEISGIGNVITTEFRENDTRLGGRWWSPDRIVKPWESPYAGYGNNPIYYNDPSGLDPPPPPGGGTAPDPNNAPGNTTATKEGDDYVFTAPKNPKPSGSSTPPAAPIQKPDPQTPTPADHTQVNTNIELQGLKPSFEEDKTFSVTPLVGFEHKGFGLEVKPGEKNVKAGPVSSGGDGIDVSAGPIPIFGISDKTETQTTTTSFNTNGNCWVCPGGQTITYPTTVIRKTTATSAFIFTQSYRTTSVNYGPPVVEQGSGLKLDASYGKKGFAVGATFQLNGKWDTLKRQH